MRFSSLQADARACFAAAVAAVEPGRAVARALAREGDALVLRNRTGDELARHVGPVCLVGAGKAGVAMARAAHAIAVPSVTGGVVIVPHGSEVDAVGPIHVRHGAHPVPDAASVASTRALLDVIHAADADTLVLVVLSGGASALLAAASEDIALPDLQALTRALVAAGAEIGALNTVRKHCSRVTGGGIARAAREARGCWALVLSDVVGDDLATIGSGPTVADPTTYRDALAVLGRYGIAAPAAIEAHLRRGAAGEVPETPKAGDRLFDRVWTTCVAGNADAVAGAVVEAQRRGFVVTQWPPVDGDAGVAGTRVARALRALPGDVPVALIAGGETTVRARLGGLGGRSQHLALAAALGIDGLPAVVLAAGTDGVDGPTRAAGACVDGDTIARARRMQLDPAAALVATDSHRVLAATGDLVVTGSTGTNVADVVVALRAPT